MSVLKLIALVVLVAIAATLVQPARAEALEPTVVLTIVGVAVGVLLIIAVIVIANVRESQRGQASDGAVLVALDAGGVQAQ